MITILNSKCIEKGENKIRTLYKDCILQDTSSNIDYKETDTKNSTKLIMDYYLIDINIVQFMTAVIIIVSQAKELQSEAI